MEKKRPLVLIISLVVFLTFLLTTSPYRLPLIFVVVPGAAFIIAAHSLFSLGIGMLPVKRKAGRSIVNTLTVIIAVLAVLLSVGQLTIRDFTLLLALALLGMFYLSRVLDR